MVLLHIQEALTHHSNLLYKINQDFLDILYTFI